MRPSVAIKFSKWHTVENLCLPLFYDLVWNCNKQVINYENCEGSYKPPSGTQLIEHAPPNLAGWVRFPVGSYLRLANSTCGMSSLVLGVDRWVQGNSSGSGAVINSPPMQGCQMLDKECVFVQFMANFRQKNIKQQCVWQNRFSETPCFSQFIFSIGLLFRFFKV